MKIKNKDRTLYLMFFKNEQPIKCCELCHLFIHGDAVLTKYKNVIFYILDFFFFFTSINIKKIFLAFAKMRDWKDDEHCCETDPIMSLSCVVINVATVTVTSLIGGSFFRIVGSVVLRPKPQRFMACRRTIYPQLKTAEVVVGMF